MVYIITYDLRKAGQNYDALYKKIISLGQTCHAMQNLWLLDTNYSVSVVCDNLRSVVDQNDYIFTAQLFRGSYYGYMSNEAIDWLNRRF